MKVSILGAGNVGVAIAADLSISGHEVKLIKTSANKSKSFERILENGNRVYLKENGSYKETRIKEVTDDISLIAETDVVIVTIQSTYHEDVIKKISKYLHRKQVVISICSYMASQFFKKYCEDMPCAVMETTGPYLEGRVEMEDMKDEVVFRVGCRLTKSPLSVYGDKNMMGKIKELYIGFSDDYNVVESALLNPNMVLHTVGAIMSIPRIEYSKGNFCMYREAYTRCNEATLSIMLALDKEKQNVLNRLGCKPIDILEAGGFLGDPWESFFKYSESEDRAISPTSVKSRYITEDVSQGLVLLESIAKSIGVATPIATALIDIAGAALHVDFREIGRTLNRLDVGSNLSELVS